MLPILAQLPKSVLVALLSMPVGTRVILVTHIIFICISLLMSSETFSALFGLQPFLAIFQLQRLFSRLSILPLIRSSVSISHVCLRPDGPLALSRQHAGLHSHRQVD